jgi:Caspase domain
MEPNITPDTQRSKRRRTAKRSSMKKATSSSQTKNKNRDASSTLAPLPSPPAGGEFKRKGTDYALFIATDEYAYSNWKRLGNPTRDAIAVAKTLEDNYGFKTEIVKNPILSDVVVVLEKYLGRQYEDGDQLFIFIAGHGHYIQNTRQGYLVFKDSLPVEKDRIGSTYLSYPILRNLIDNIPCKHILLVIDACYSGTFDEAIAKRGPLRGSADPPLPRFIEAKMQYTTRRYITSAANQPVYDGDKDKNSPFTSRLLEAFRNFGGQSGYLTIASIEVNLQTLTPTPLSDKWGQDEPGSEFFFFAKRP